ncbi:hypothetical protein M9435_004265 [Picochlorum sp. BPE23]|nr:hypothetical protein M9435_004265 [Picochlorum sp. BPE23]
MGTANKAQAPAKAKLRGVSHIIAAFLSIPFGIRLIFEASTPISRAACLVFALSTTCLFSISSIYHTPHWDPETRLMLRRWDHAAIYMLIAGTYTPFCALALDREEVNASYLLLLVWVGAILGVVHSIFNAGGFQSKMVSVALYIALGWIGIPVLSNIHDMFGPTVYTNLVAGGLTYSIGGLMYAMHWPNVAPSLFGYHEAFHICVIMASAFMYTAVKHAILQ